MRESITTMLLRKFVGWEYEEERRIIVSEAAGQFINFRPAALCGIIIGCSASDKTVDKLNEIIGERSSFRYSTPKVYRAFRDEKRFRLNIKTAETNTAAAIEGTPR